MEIHLLAVKAGAAAVGGYLIKHRKLCDYSNRNSK